MNIIIDLRKSELLVTIAGKLSNKLMPQMKSWGQARQRDRLRVTPTPNDRAGGSTQTLRPQTRCFSQSARVPWVVKCKLANLGEKGKGPLSLGICKIPDWVQIGSRRLQKVPMAIAVPGPMVVWPMECMKTLQQCSLLCSHAQCGRWCVDALPIPPFLVTEAASQDCG